MTWTGPGRTAPGWIGDDAEAATAQIGLVADLVNEIGGAVLIATGHLSAHADRLREARRRVADLRAEQDDDHRVAWIRWGDLEMIQAQVAYDGAGAMAVVEDLRASEEARRRRHEALLTEVEEDAAATARVLAESCAVVGGTGRPGGEARTLAHLAALLPGWGAAELAARGAALATALTTSLASAQRGDLIQQALSYASSATYAGAFLAGLGVEGMQDTLRYIGEGVVAEDSALARLTAAVLATVTRSGVDSPEVAAVVSARYVDPVDPDVAHDYAALGIGAVLAASLSLGRRGIAAQTVSSWGQQLLLRERNLTTVVLDRTGPLRGDAAPVDAIPLVVDLIVQSGDESAAAALLAAPGVWDALLARAWLDCGVGMSHLVEQATGDGLVSADAVVRAGLEALGAGLADHDPDGWTVNRATAAAVTTALLEATVLQVGVVGEALTSVGAEHSAQTVDLLHGLGYLTISRDPAEKIAKALAGWAAAAPVDDRELVGLTEVPAFTAPAAYVAVQEYGQRLAEALYGFEQQAFAEDRAFLFDMTIGLIPALLPDPVDTPFDVVTGYLAMWLGFDGRWSNGPVRGTFDPDDAVVQVVANLSGEQGAALERIAHKSREAYERTATLIGSPKPPQSGEAHWYGPLVDALIPGPLDLVGRRGKPVPSPVR